MAYSLSPRSVERDNQNAMRKYPFSDAATCSSGGFAIPAGAIVDAQLYVHADEASPVWLSEIGADGILRFSTPSGVIAETVAPVSPESAVPVVFTGDGVRLPGGVVVFGKREFAAALLTYGGHSFSREDTELAPAAVTFTAAPGLFGFKLDDGSVVSGNVRFRGANGCDVATYIGSDESMHLRISALGRQISSSPVTGFIKRVVAESDNTSFVVAADDLSDHVINISATGVLTVLDDDLNADQFSVCARVKAIRGTLPSAFASPQRDCDPCDTTTPEYRTIRLFVNGTQVGVRQVLQGSDLGRVQVPVHPDVSSGLRFSGYYATVTDSTGSRHVLYYRADGSGVGRFNGSSDVDLEAHWVAASSRAEVSFRGYGTLHLAAPDADLPKYSNPVIIFGDSSPVTLSGRVTKDMLDRGGADAVADAVLHPASPGGAVHIGIRGLRKAYST